MPDRTVGVERTAEVAGTGLEQVRRVLTFEHGAGDAEPRIGRVGQDLHDARHELGVEADVVVHEQHVGRASLRPQVRETAVKPPAPPTFGFASSVTRSPPTSSAPSDDSLSTTTTSTRSCSTRWPSSAMVSAHRLRRTSSGRRNVVTTTPRCTSRTGAASVSNRASRTRPPCSRATTRRKRCPSPNSSRCGTGSRTGVGSSLSTAALATTRRLPCVGSCTTSTTSLPARARRQRHLAHGRVPPPFPYVERVEVRVEADGVAVDLERAVVVDSVRTPHEQHGWSLALPARGPHQPPYRSRAGRGAPQRVPPSVRNAQGIPGGTVEHSCR